MPNERIAWTLSIQRMKDEQGGEWEEVEVKEKEKEKFKRR